MKILFMGDSITARGEWVKYFNEIIQPELYVNIAVCGATWKDRDNTKYDGNPIFDINDYTNNTICNQVEKILRGKDKSHMNYCCNKDYSDFDVIIVSAGTNDVEVHSMLEIDEINEQFVDADRNIVLLEKTDRKTWAGAMRYTYEKLRYLYPEAAIFFCSPIQAAETRRSYKSIELKSQIIKSICDRISDVCFIDTFKCGICGIYEYKELNGRDLIDGLHPNTSGAKKIALYNAREVKKFFI